MLPSSPLLGRRGKPQINIANSEETVKFGQYLNSPPEGEGREPLKKWRNMIVGNVLLISNSERNDEICDNKASDDEMNEQEQKEY